MLPRRPRLNRALFSVLLVFALGATAWAVGGRTPDIRLSCHVEGSASETGEFVIPHETPSGERHFRKVPEFTQDRIRAYRVVETAQGQALAIQLDEAGTMRLGALTVANRGGYLLIAVNGEPREFQRIDAPVEDGVVILWGGLSPEEIAALDRQVKRNNR